MHACPDLQRNASQTAVAAYFKSKQLLLFVFAIVRACFLEVSKQILLFISASPKQPAVSVYLESEQLLLFVFARRSVCQYSMAEEKVFCTAALRILYIGMVLC